MFAPSCERRISTDEILALSVVRCVLARGREVPLHLREVQDVKPGTRVIFLDHPDWRGGKLQGYEGRIVQQYARIEGRLFVPLAYDVKLDFLVRIVKAHPAIICPVYNDCEICGYAAWSNENRGTDEKPEWHHFCAWHIPEP